MIKIVLMLNSVTIVDVENLILIITNQYRWPEFFFVTRNHYRWLEFYFGYR